MAGNDDEQRRHGTAPVPPPGVALLGIVNVTPDSFSDGGRFLDVDAAVAHAHRLVADGAWMVDVGGESTRPGAAPVSADEELARVEPVIARLVAAGVPVSVDTRRPAVADRAVRVGATLVNDVSGLRDPEMVAVAADHGVGVVVMHSPAADPQAAHRHPGYGDVVAAVIAHLAAHADAAVAAGVPSVLVDPGIGFGKSADDNLALLARLDEIVALGHPVLVGASRKRFLGALSGVDEPDGRDAASIAAHLAAVAAGARVLRVHDVAGHAQALRIWSAIAAARR